MATPPRPDHPVPDPLDTPISRRCALLVMGAGAIAAGGGLGTILAGCGPSLPDFPVWVTLGLDPSELPGGRLARHLDVARPQRRR
jgi:hypothetical protein